MTIAATPSADYEEHIVGLIEREQARFARTYELSAHLSHEGEQHYLYGGASHWMRRWAGGCPMYVETAAGTCITDVDGNDYVDFALGNTGAMCGHADPAITKGVARQLACGAATNAAWRRQPLGTRSRRDALRLIQLRSDFERSLLRHGHSVRCGWRSQIFFHIKDQLEPSSSAPWLSLFNSQRRFRQ